MFNQLFLLSTRGVNLQSRKKAVKKVVQLNVSSF